MKAPLHVARKALALSFYLFTKRIVHSYVNCSSAFILHVFCGAQDSLLPTNDVDNEPRSLMGACMKE